MSESVRKRIYAYKVTSDTGNAPCAQDGLLTLSCCKGGRIVKGKAQLYGMRKEIGAAFKNINCDEEFFLLGIYHGEVLYFAKIDEVITMAEYNNREYNNKRRDQIYDYNEENEPIRNKNNRLFHPDSCEEFKKRDNAGRYAVLCKEFVYYGKCSCSTPKIKDLNASFTTHENRYFKLLTGNEADAIYARFSKEISKGELGKPHERLTDCNSGGCYQK